ncbi:MAG: hypothetical protein LBV29_03050 [Azoarcus sp.]|jgi:hypothetical protein|nr:hypothetical protein [Azoarcus sp.]
MAMDEVICERTWVTEAGLAAAVFYVMRSHRCGYVCVSQGHVLHGKDYLDSDFDVHGGLTYANDAVGNLPRASDEWWFGFDCNHVQDGSDNPIFNLVKDPNAPVRTLEYCEAECEKLAQQLVNYEPPSLKRARLLGEREVGFVSDELMKALTFTLAYVIVLVLLAVIFLKK